MRSRLWRELDEGVLESDNDTLLRHSCLADDKARPKTVVKWNVVILTLKR